MEAMKNNSGFATNASQTSSKKLVCDGLGAAAHTNARFFPRADIAKVQEWLGHANSLHHAPLRPA